MLKLIYRMKELDFSQFLEVCKESVSENDPGASQLFDYIHLMFCNGGACAVWIHEGVYVSALRLELYRDGYLITGLETAQGQRGKGFATKLITGVAIELTAQNTKALYAHVKRSNRASLRVHDKCGFITILDHAVFLDGSVDTRSVTLQKML